MRVSPAICNRVVDAVHGVLNQFVSYIYIYTDHCKGGQFGKYVIFQQTFKFFTRKSACFTTIHAVNIHNKTKNYPGFYISLLSLQLTMFLILFTKRGTIDIADPSSMQDVSHI